MSTRKSKILTKDIHANENVNLMKENVIQIKSGIMINVDVSEKNNICDKDYIWNPATYTSIVDDHSVITCDEIIRETKTVPTNFNEKK